MMIKKNTRWFISNLYFDNINAGVVNLNIWLPSPAFDHNTLDTECQYSKQSHPSTKTHAIESISAWQCFCVTFPLRMTNAHRHAGGSSFGQNRLFCSIFHTHTHSLSLSLSLSLFEISVPCCLLKSSLFNSIMLLKL